MRRLDLLMATLCLCAVTTTPADAEEPKQAAASFDDVRTLTVAPRAVEQPLMKYRLFPAEYELRDGNAAPVLLRLPWDQTPYFSTVVPTFSDYLELPLDDPKVLGSEDLFGPTKFEQLKRAAYMRTANWEYPIGEEPLAKIMLPDVQASRDIAGRGLSVRIRALIANGKLAEAREGILVGFAVSRHYGRTPFVITQLVCAAIDSVMIARLEELISQPECPNLYWAIVGLPRPMVDLRAAVEMEQQMLEGSVPALNQLDSLETAEQWDETAQAVVKLLEIENRPSAGQDDRRRVPLAAEWARARRSEWAGDHADRVEEMSDSEVLVRWLAHTYRDHTQELAATMFLEPTVAIPRLRELNQRAADLESTLGFPILFVLKNPLRVYLSAHGVDRRFDALRIVEAIRHYAATHESQLPQSLDQITALPVPTDPWTGEPFAYEVSGRTAVLRAVGIDVGTHMMGAIDYRIELRDGSQ